MARKIRVMVIDDSMLIRQVLQKELPKDPAIEVVACASNPIEAKPLILQLKPDVLTLDVEMPQMDGLTFLSILQTFYPVPVVMLSTLTAEGSRFEKVKQTTQFVVGASDETDRELVQYSWGLYQRLGMHRIYFSAYQRGAGAADLPGEHGTQNNADLLTREHRLYQVDWLIRKYGFSETQIPFESGGNLSLISDPKEIWARHHPEFFPLDINRAGKFDLLKVPGLGPRTVGLILRARYEGRQIRHIEDLGPRGKRLQKAEGYLKFGERVSLFE